MSFIRSSQFAVDISGSVPGGNISVSAMPEHKEDDLIIAVYAKDDFAGGQWSVPSGYTTIESLTLTGYINMATFYKVANGDNTELPPVSNTTDTNDTQAHQIIIVGDIDTADPINVSNGQGYNGNENSQTGGTVSTDEDGTLNIWVNCVEGQARFPYVDSEYMGLPVPIPHGTGNIVNVWQYQKTSGSVTHPTFHQMTADTGQVTTICINNNNTDPIEPPRVDVDSPPTTILHPLRGALTGSDAGGSSVDPSSDFTGGLGPNSLNFDYRAVETGGGGGTYGWSDASHINNPGSSSNNNVWGAVWSFTETDLSDSILALNVYTQGRSFIGIGGVNDAGIIAGLRSDDGGGGKDYRLWNVSAIDSVPNIYDGQHSVVFDVEDTTFEWDEVGTFDETAVDGVFLGYNKAFDVTTRIYFCELHKLNPIVLVGGANSWPCTFNTFVDAMVSSRLLTVTNQSGSQFLSMQSLQLGNGTDDVCFAQAYASMEFAATTNTSLNIINMNAAATKTGLEIHTTAGSSIDLSNQVWSGPQGWPLTFNSGCSASADYLSDATVIQGANVTLRDVFTTQSGITFTNCDEVITNSADLSGGCIFDNTYGTTQITISSQADLDDLDNCTFQNQSRAITLNFPTGNHTLNASNLTFTDNTTDLHFDGAGNITWNNLSGSNADGAKITGTGAGNVTVQASAPVDITAKDASDSSLITGARIYLEADTGGDLAAGTVILNDTTNGSGVASVSHSYTNPQPVIGYARKGSVSPRYKNAPISGTINADGLALDVFMVNDG